MRSLFTFPLLSLVAACTTLPHPPPPPPPPELQKAGVAESIEIQIQYNRLWQNSIAANRAGYDRETRLEKAVVERQAIRDALAASDDAALRTREATLSREIHDATGHLSPPPFLRIERVSRGRVVVHVPVYTDIQDKKFLRAFESAVEGIWHVTDGDDDFRVELEFKRESPRRLYAPTGAAPPKAGDPIDEQKHCDLFPGGAAILTTGASTGHVRGMRCMVMGAYAISPHDLAHEFGHVLGFKDVYFRGYEDLGADGFEVHEVIAESDDIMGAPGSAPVTKRQFTRLIEALARSEDD